MVRFGIPINIFNSLDAQIGICLSVKLKLNKIAARWPAKAVAQFSVYHKKAVTGLSQDSIVKVRPITNFKHGLSPNNCL